MYHFQEKFNKLIDDMVLSGKIIPSNSSWASPVRLVAKPDGGFRLTVVYKQLNIYTKKVAYPLPKDMLPRAYETTSRCLVTRSGRDFR